MTDKEKIYCKVIKALSNVDRNSEFKFQSIHFKDNKCTVWLILNDNKTRSFSFNYLKKTKTKKIGEKIKGLFF